MEMHRKCGQASVDAILPPPKLALVILLHVVPRAETDRLRKLLTWCVLTVLQILLANLVCCRIHSRRSFSFLVILAWAHETRHSAHFHRWLAPPPGPPSYQIHLV